MGLFGEKDRKRKPEERENGKNQKQEETEEGKRKDLCNQCRLFRRGMGYQTGFFELRTSGVRDWTTVRIERGAVPRGEGSLP